MDNFIEHRNFLKIYHYNKIYKPEHRRHKRALNFQLVIALVCIGFVIINRMLPAGVGFESNLYLDQIDRIYALLIGILTAILIGITPIDGKRKLQTPQYDYTPITHKQDYTSIVMYTIFLFMAGLVSNVVYASFIQYWGSIAVTTVFWAIRLFLLFDSLFFTVYAVDELSDLIQKM